MVMRNLPEGKEIAAVLLRVVVTGIETEAIAIALLKRVVEA